MNTFTPLPRPWAVAAVAGLILASAAWGQAYPGRPVRIVIPLSPGGTTDVPGRIVAQKLSETLGQQFFVENRAGAGGTIGADYVAKSKPDGYTLLLTASPFVIAPHVYKNMPYDALADFAPVIRIASGPYVLLVHPSLGVSSVKELIAQAKKEPGKIDFASSGNGSAQHLVTELFMYMTGIKLNHVPYKGSGPAQQDLMSGIIKVSFVGTPIAIPHMKSGRLKALGVSTATRSPEMPDVPTIAEAGVPGYEAIVWIGMLAPAGTPREIVARLNGEIGKLVRTDEVKKLLAPTGMEPDPDTPEQFGAYLKGDYDKWGKVVRESGATVQ
ncbi:MAG TPA: tripartite tricarboxylate transporter substrate binding protein [Burkholderiales bacterium]|nr:tripartite tricarboxylate transporter substrate binding protein [Burkholderiales bacterium]